MTSVQNETVLAPAYLDAFECIGPRCEDSCCSGFGTVHIDRQTYMQYQAISSRTKRLHVLDNIELHSEPNDAYYASIMKRPDGSCPFWGLDSLCELQTEFGEKALSYSCLTYPRVTNFVGERKERSLSLTCPEAARIILLRAAPLTFREFELPVGRFAGLFTKQLKFDREGYSQTCFDALRELIVAMLQDRSRRLWQRLSLVGIVCEQIEFRAKCSPAMPLAECVSDLQRRYLAGTLSEQGDIDPPVSEHMLRLYLQLLAAGLVYDGIGKRYVQCVKECNQGLGISAQPPYSADPAAFHAALRTHFAEFERLHGHMLEHYLVNTVFQSLFPLCTGLTVLESFRLLLLRYALLRVQLAGLGALHSSVSTECALVLFQSFAKGFEHHESGLRALGEFLRLQGYTDPDRLIELIRD